MEEFRRAVMMRSALAFQAISGLMHCLFSIHARHPRAAVGQSPSTAANAIVGHHKIIKVLSVVVEVQTSLLCDHSTNSGSHVLPTSIANISPFINLRGPALCLLSSPASPCVSLHVRERMTMIVQPYRRMHDEHAICSTDSHFVC